MLTLATTAQGHSGKEQNRDLARAFQYLRDLKVDVTFPILLELYRDYDQKRLPMEDFIQAVQLVEAYLFRRAVCAIPTNSHNKTFATFGRALRKDLYIESIKGAFHEYGVLPTLPNRPGIC